MSVWTDDALLHEVYQLSKLPSVIWFILVLNTINDILLYNTYTKTVI